jgi:hypothetical protein
LTGKTYTRPSKGGAAKKRIPAPSSARNTAEETLTKKPAGREPAGIFVYIPIHSGCRGEFTVVNKMLAKIVCFGYLCI